jgi:hypothetical protein
LDDVSQPPAASFEALAQEPPAAGFIRRTKPAKNNLLMGVKIDMPRSFQKKWLYVVIEFNPDLGPFISS